MKRIQRVGLAVTGAATCLLLAACASNGGPADGGDSQSGTGSLAFVSFGGALQEGGEISYSQPFQEQTGITVISDGPTDYAKLRSMVEADQVSWDVVEGDPFFAIAECGTLLEPIDTSIIDTSRLPEEFVSECSVPSVAVSNILMYDNAEFESNAPTSWADFFNTKKFPGKRAVWSDVYAGNLEIALLADGVAPEDLYPLDVDRALAKYDSIKDDLIFWDSGAQSQQLMDSQEVSMLWAWSGRAYDAVKNGADFSAVWNQNQIVPNGWMVPKGTKNKDAAMEFIAHATSAEAQTAIAEAIPYAPINIDADPKLDELAMDFLPSNPENQKTQVPIDVNWYAEHYSEAQKAWDGWRIG